MSKLSYKDKVALAAHQFDVHKGVNEVFVCANGQVFFGQNSAMNQDKEKKLDEKFEKITRTDVEKEAFKSKTKAYVDDVAAAKAEKEAKEAAAKAENEANEAAAAAAEQAAKDAAEAAKEVTAKGSK